jgi:hypothetical protein
MPSQAKNFMMALSAALLLARLNARTMARCSVLSLLPWLLAAAATLLPEALAAAVSCKGRPTRILVTADIAAAFAAV